MFLNLLYKSLKADVVLRRLKAFVKRLLQVSAEQSASFVCGALFLVSELMKTKPGLKLLLQEGGVRGRGQPLRLSFRTLEKRRCLLFCLQEGEDEEFKDLTDEEDEEERFLDVDKKEDGVSVDTEAKPAASWVHHQNLEGRSFDSSFIVVVVVAAASAH